MTLVELLLALAIGALLVAGLAGVVEQSLAAWDATRERNDLTQQARFAMERMAAAVSASPTLLLPLAENPATPQSESLRDLLATGLDPTLDRDADGVADADNDADGLVNEDAGADTNRAAPGIIGIDDDNDGAADEGLGDDDDEDGAVNEDPVDGLDNDGDGAIDEDPNADAQGDGAPGIAGFDDDGDGFTDEGNNPDDDEDGSNNEDWIDPVVYFLSGTTLMERLPDLNPADGTDYTERPIAENVSQLRVERLATGPNDRAVLVDLTLALTAPSGESVTLHTRVRVGGAP
jgi:type II secretory pathway pseudopilin PulG